MRALLVLALAGCNAAGPADAPPAPRALGLDDVSVLVPLPSDVARPTLVGITGDGAPLVDEALVASLVFANEIAPKNQLPVAYGDFQVVAVRFDPCTRSIGDACTGDGRLRLVLQPMYTTKDGVFAHDIALHAFYPLPAGELPGLVDELRALAALDPVPVDARLGVRPFASADYAARLRALVLRYARADRLLELTVIGQDAESAAFAWIFGGFVRTPDGFVPRTIPSLGERTEQHVLVAGGDAVYHVTPGADVPVGFGLTLSGATFAAANPDEQRVAIAALVEIENPTRHDANDVQCAACHVATFLSVRRAQVAGIDLAALPDRYTSRFDVGVDSIAGTDPRVIRAFGWAGNQPAISQRVANDTSLALTMFERRVEP